MNVGELTYIERLILADVGPRSEFGDTHADKCWSEYDSLARRAIAAEKLVGTLSYLQRQAENGTLHPQVVIQNARESITVYEATK